MTIAWSARTRHAAQRPRQDADLPVAATGPEALLRLQRTAGNAAVAHLVARRLADPSGARPSAAGPKLPVQRVKDAFDVALARADLRLAPAFRAKHVADDPQAAIAVTDARYRAGKMPAAMEQGRMPNTVATQDTWLDRLDASPTLVDTEDGRWTNGVGLDVDGWEVLWHPSQERYEVVAKRGISLSGGGYATARTSGRRNTQVVGGTFTLDHIQGR